MGKNVSSQINAFQISQEKKKSHVSFWFPWFRSLQHYSKFCVNIQLQELGLELVMLVLAKVFFSPAPPLPSLLPTQVLL